MEHARALFGTSFSCACGRTHTLSPETVVYGEDAATRLPGLLPSRPAGPVAVLFDLRTRAAAGQAVLDALAAAGVEVREILLADPPGGTPVCDDRTAGALRPRLTGASAVVSVGSGVVCDLGKWTAFDLGLPFLVFATAASMNGYASANVAPTIGGLKTLVRARPPTAVLASPAVLAAAPAAMTASGLGDLLAKPVSSADWVMNHLLFGDYLCRRSIDLIAEIEPQYLGDPEGLARGDAKPLAALFESLLLTGAAMTLAESSAPSSGGEHMLSHALDMMSGIDGRPHDLHGRQVGIGTVLACGLYRRVLSIESPDWRLPDAGPDRAFWGPLADAMAREVEAKQPRLEAAVRVLSNGDAWDRLRRELGPLLRPPEAVGDCLRRAGAAWRAADLGIDRARLRAAFAHAHEIRSRFTILDLARIAGVMPGAIDEELERAEI